MAFVETLLLGTFLLVRSLADCTGSGDCANLQSTGVQAYQWYYRVNHGQVLTYSFENTYAASTSITIKLTPLDSTCDPDLFVFKGPWTGAYGWKSERGYGEDAVTLQQATLKDLRGAYTVEVHGGVPGPFVLRVYINYTGPSQYPPIPAAAPVASDDFEEYYWYRNVATDATDYYFFKNRFQNTQAIVVRLIPLTVGDPDLKIYQGQWTGVYDWVSSQVTGSEVITIRPGDMQLGKHGGFVGDYAVEVRGVFAATYKLEVKIYFNHSLPRRVDAHGVLQREEKSFLYIAHSAILTPGSLAYMELAEGSAEDVLTVRVNSPTSLTISVSPCISALELMVPSGQVGGRINYHEHKGSAIAYFDVETAADIRILVRGVDSEFQQAVPYQVAVDSTETLEMKHALKWETLSNDKIVVSWPPLRLDAAGSVAYRVAIGTLGDRCGLDESDLSVVTAVPTAILELPADLATRAVTVVAEVQIDTWHTTVPYLSKELATEEWDLVRLLVLAGLIAAVAVMCCRRKGTDWTELRDDGVYRRLIEQQDK